MPVPHVESRVYINCAVSLVYTQISKGMTAKHSPLVRPWSTWENCSHFLQGASHVPVHFVKSPWIVPMDMSSLYEQCAKQLRTNMYFRNYKHVKQLNFLNIWILNLLSCMLYNYERKVMNNVVLVKNTVFT